MAQSSVVFEISADEARLLRSLQESARAYANLDSAAAKLTKTTREQAKAEADMGREAKRVYEETRSPMEQHQARMTALNELLAAGAVNQDTFNRAAKQAKRDLDDVGKSGEAAFGKEAVSRITSFAASFLGIQQAGQMVIGVFDKMREIKAEAAEGAKASSMSFGESAPARLKGDARGNAARHEARRPISTKSRGSTTRPAALAARRRPMRPSFS